MTSYSVITRDSSTLWIVWSAHLLLMRWNKITWAARPSVHNVIKIVCVLTPTHN